MPVTWEEPGRPRAGRPPGPVRWAAEARDLIARPGTWGLIAAVPLDGSACELSRLRSAVRRIHTASFRAFRPAGSFEAASRTIPEEGVVKLFARYVGVTVAEPGQPPVQVAADGTVLPVTPRPGARRPAAPARRPPARLARQASRADTAQARQWARVNGHEVSDSGRLAQSVYRLYDQATGRLAGPDGHLPGGSA